jgi:hypothetical protein
VAAAVRRGDVQLGGSDALDATVEIPEHRRARRACPELPREA